MLFATSIADNIAYGREGSTTLEVILFCVVTCFKYEVIRVGEGRQPLRGRCGAYVDHPSSAPIYLYVRVGVSGCFPESSCRYVIPLHVSAVGPGMFPPKRRRKCSTSHRARQIKATSNGCCVHQSTDGIDQIDVNTVRAQHLAASGIRSRRPLGRPTRTNSSARFRMATTPSWAARTRGCSSPATRSRGSRSRALSSG